MSVANDNSGGRAEDTEEEMWDDSEEREKRSCGESGLNCIFFQVEATGGARGWRRGSKPEGGKGARERRAFTGMVGYVKKAAEAADEPCV